MRDSFKAVSLEEQDTASNKVGKAVDKQASRDIIAGFFRAFERVLSQGWREEKVNGLLTR